MKLGQRVVFSKVLKPAGEGVAWGLLTDEQERMLENDGFIRVHKNKEVELDTPKEGILVGIRKIGKFTDLEYYDGHNSDGLRVLNWDSEKVYLVASDLRGIYKVRPDSLEMIE